MNAPPFRRYSITTDGDRVVIRHDGDPAAAVAWVRGLILRATADHALRAGADHPVLADVDPIAVRLRQLREERHLSCRAVGEVMGVGRARVGAYEHGRVCPRLDVVRAWAYVLGHDLALTPRPVRAVA